MLNVKYYFHRRKMILREKYSLKLEARIVSCTKSNNSLTNALVKHEAEHKSDIFKNERSNCWREKCVRTWQARRICSMEPKIRLSST